MMMTMSPELTQEIKLQGKERLPPVSLYPEVTHHKADGAENPGGSVAGENKGLLGRDTETLLAPAPAATLGPDPLYPPLASIMAEEPGDWTEANGSATKAVDLVHWQRGKNVLDCNRHMLENQVACDVWFSVGTERREHQEERGVQQERGAGERVGAHAYVLRSRSSAFCAVLGAEEERGEGGSRRGQDIHLPGTSPRVFWQLLRYLYYEDLHPEADTVLELLGLALTYDVVALREACLRFLQGCLTVGTACAVLETAHHCEDRQLSEACLTFIQQHGKLVLQSAGVTQLCRECLDKVLTLEGLELTPSQRQDVEDRWASSHHQDIPSGEASADSKPQSLDDDVAYVKKHHEQSCRFFPGNSKDKRFPLKAESRNSTRSRRSKKTSEKSHLPRAPSKTPGEDLHQVSRFTEFEGSLTNTGRTADALSFSVTLDILLYGFGIYGSTTPGEASYQVKTVLSREKEDMSLLSLLLGKNPDLVLEVISITGVGLVLPVMLEKPVKLKRGKTYTLEIYVTGPPSHCGVSGHSKVKVSPMTFTFSKPVDVKGNRTSVRNGQIPRLFYLPY